MSDPEFIRMFADLSPFTDGVTKQFVEEARDLKVVDRSTKSVEIQKLIDLFFKSDLARTSLGKRVYSTLQEYYQEGRIRWGDARGPAAIFQLGKKVILVGRDDDSRQIILDEVFKGTTYSKTKLIHEAVHAVNWKEKGHDYHKLYSEMDAHAFEVKYYKDLIDRKIVGRNDRLETQLKYYGHNKLIDFLMVEYREKLDAEFVVNSYKKWGGIRNREAETRGYYARELVGELESSTLSWGNSKYLDVLGEIIFSDFSGSRFNESETSTKASDRELRIRMIEKVSNKKLDNPMDFEPLPNIKRGANRLLAVFPEERRMELKEFYNSYSIPYE